MECNMFCIYISQMFSLGPQEFMNLIYYIVTIDQYSKGTAIIVLV